MGSDFTNEAEKCRDLNAAASSPEKLSTNVVIAGPLKEALGETDSLGPITPDSDRENVEFPVEFDSSPTTGDNVERVALEDSETDNRSSENDSPHTPKEGVFDPFAPGPDHMAMAPQCRKHISKSRGIVARRLSFDSSVEEPLEFKDCCCAAMSSVSDEEIVQAVYESLLETIVSRQTEAVLAEISKRDWDSSHCVTPPSVPRLNGIAETCPGAPMRPSGRSRRIDPVLCRRLEFSP